MARVLVLEDEAILHKLYKKVLEQNGFEVLSAHNLAEARQAIESQDFDFFIADLRLPDGNAATLLKDYQARLKDKGVQVIVLTAEARQRDELEALGYEYYFEKPVSLQMLVQFLQRLQASQA